MFYSGFISHSDHEIAKKQMKNGFGGMHSILNKCGAAETKPLAPKLQLLIPATSLGGVESLVEHRTSVEGPLSLVKPNL